MNSVYLLGYDCRLLFAASACFAAANQLKNSQRIECQTHGSKSTKGQDLICLKKWQPHHLFNSQWTFWRILLQNELEGNNKNQVQWNWGRQRETERERQVAPQLLDPLPRGGGGLPCGGTREVMRWPKNVGRWPQNWWDKAYHNLCLQGTIPLGALLSSDLWNHHHHHHTHIHWMHDCSVNIMSTPTLTTTTSMTLLTFPSISSHTTHTHTHTVCLD